MVLQNLKTNTGITGAFLGALYLVDTEQQDFLPLMAIVVKILASLSIFGTCL